MRLRRPCIHGLYDVHAEKGWPVLGNAQACPGGEFLDDAALVIEKVDGEWPEWALNTLAIKWNESGLRASLLDSLFAGVEWNNRRRRPIATVEWEALGPDPNEDFEEQT